MTTYTPENAKLEKLVATNARVQDLLNNAADKTDHAVWVPSWQCGITTDSLALALTRNAAGDYSHNGTANGVENIFIFASVPAFLRTTSNKGYKLSTVKAVYEVGVVDATTITLALNQTGFAHDTAHAIAAHGGTLSFDANHDTNAERVASAAGSNPHVLTCTLGTPAFNNTSLVVVNADLTLVLANTGTFKFYGFEFGFTADYL